MYKEEIIKSIRRVSQSVMPVGAKVILFGSQARNEEHEESDWDILILFNKNERVNNDDFDKMAYPFVELGWEMGTSINPIIYSCMHSCTLFKYLNKYVLFIMLYA